MLTVWIIPYLLRRWWRVCFEIFPTSPSTHAGGVKVCREKGIREKADDLRWRLIGWYSPSMRIGLLPVFSSGRDGGSGSTTYLHLVKPGAEQSSNRWNHGKGPSTGCAEVWKGLGLRSQEGLLLGPLPSCWWTRVWYWYRGEIAESRLVHEIPRDGVLGHTRKIVVVVP